MRATVGTLIVLSMLLAASAARAVEVRRGPAPAFSTLMQRAYAPCLAPNTTTDQGLPACYPAITSVCRASGFLTVDGGAATLAVNRSVGPTATAFCKAGPYRFDVTIRPTFDPLPGDPSCNAPVCTLPDVTVSAAPFDLETVSRTITTGLFVPGVGIANNFEIRSATLIGPDDLPVLAADATASLDRAVVRTLSVGYDACVAPAPELDSCPATWTSPCDFASGSIGTRTGAIPNFTTTLHGLSGLSPLCTAGTYHLEARARVTVDGCGPVDAENRSCTLPDADYVMPIPVSGSEVERTTSLAGGIDDRVRTEVLGLRLLDPTGALFAAPASNTMLALGEATTVTMKEDRLQIRTVFPFDFDFDLVDPTEDDGVTVTLHDKNGGIYAVTIPGTVWQLQPPLGERWELRDPGGVIGGIRKARIKLLRKKGLPVGYDVRLDARGVDLSGADLASATLTVAIARPDPNDLGPKTASRHRVCRDRGAKKQCR